MWSKRTPFVYIFGVKPYTPNLDPPPFDTGRPLSSNRLCPLARCTGFKKRDTTEAALLARAASGLSLVAGERGGLISSRTARGVRVNLVSWAMEHGLPQTRPAESSTIRSDTGTGSRSRSHAAQARFFLAARRSEHGLVFYAPADLGDEQHVLGLGDFSGSRCHAFRSP